MNYKKEKQRTKNVIKRKLLYWKRNDDCEFDPDPFDEPKITFEPRWGQLTVSLAHWLVERLTYSKKIDGYFQKAVDAFHAEYGKLATPSYNYEREFARFVNGATRGHLRNVTADVAVESRYTYNEGGACFLERDIHFAVVRLDDPDGHVGDIAVALVKVHTGRDARWGFTGTVPFIIDSDDEWDMFRYTNADLFCNECGVSFDTDDGGYSYTLYDENSDWYLRTPPANHTGSFHYDEHYSFERMYDAGSAKRAQTIIALLAQVEKYPPLKSVAGMTLDEAAATRQQRRPGEAALAKLQAIADEIDEDLDTILQQFPYVEDSAICPCCGRGELEPDYYYDY